MNFLIDGDLTQDHRIVHDAAFFQLVFVSSVADD